MRAARRASKTVNPGLQQVPDDQKALEQASGKVESGGFRGRPAARREME
jgi:hypothetical protein